MLLTLFINQIIIGSLFDYSLQFSITDSMDLDPMQLERGVKFGVKFLGSAIVDGTSKSDASNAIKLVLQMVSRNVYMKVFFCA